MRAKHNPRFLTASLKLDWCRLLVSITGGDFITFRLWVREKIFSDCSLIFFPMMMMFIMFMMMTLEEAAFSTHMKIFHSLSRS